MIGEPWYVTGQPAPRGIVDGEPLPDHRREVNLSGPFYIRSSSLPGAAGCMRCHAARQFRSLVEASGHKLRRIPTGAGAVVGSAVHAGTAVVMTEKANSGTLAPASVAADAAIENLRSGVASGVGYDDMTPNLTAAEKQVVKMTGAYCRVIAPQVNPVRVEKRLKVQISPMVILTGQSDIVAVEDHGVVRDTKTGKTRGKYRAQYGSYSVLWRAHGFHISAVKEDFVQRVAHDKLQPDPQTFQPDITGCEIAALRIIGHIERSLTIFLKGDEQLGIKAGDPWAFMANPAYSFCSPKFCEAWGTSWCREHAGND